MDLKLNIYDKKEITKTYTAETYDLMFGTVEDLLDVIDIDNIQASNKAELLKAIAKVLASSMNIVKPLLKEVFDGLTDEELRHTKLKEIMNVIAEIIAYSINQITKGNDGKTRRGEYCVFPSIKYSLNLKWKYVIVFQRLIHFQ